MSDAEWELTIIEDLEPIWRRLDALETRCVRLTRELDLEGELGWLEQVDQ